MEEERLSVEIRRASLSMRIKSSISTYISDQILRKSGKTDVDWILLDNKLKEYEKEATKACEKDFKDWVEDGNLKSYTVTAYDSKGNIGYSKSYITKESAEEKVEDLKKLGAELKACYYDFYGYDFDSEALFVIDYGYSDDNRDVRTEKFYYYLSMYPSVDYKTFIISETTLLY